MAKNKGAAERTPLLTVRETADVLGIGVNQAYAAVKAGQIPSIKINEKRIIVPRAALEKMLAGEAQVICASAASISKQRTRCSACSRVA